MTLRHFYQHNLSRFYQGFLKRSWSVSVVMPMGKVSVSTMIMEGVFGDPRECYCFFMVSLCSFESIVKKLK